MNTTRHGMDEMNKATAKEAGTSVWLLKAEFTARTRYETSPDVDVQADAFTEGAAWALANPPREWDSQADDAGDDGKLRAVRLCDQAVAALNRHEDPFSPEYLDRHRITPDEAGFVMDVLAARIAYGMRRAMCEERP